MLKKLNLILFSTLFMHSFCLAQAGTYQYKQLIDRAIKLIKSDPQQAEELLNQAIAVKPDDPLAHFYKGKMFYFHRGPDESSKEFRKALELCQTDEMRKLCVKNIAEITETFRSKEEKEYFEKAFVLIEQRRSGQAIPLLEKALSLNPDNAKLYYEIGYAYVDISQIDKAIPYLEQGRNINPSSIKILSELRYCYADKSDIEKLKEIISDLLAFHGENPWWRHELGFAYGRAEMTDSAIAVFESILEKHPQSYFTAFLLGELYDKEKINQERACELMLQFLQGVEGKTFNDFDTRQIYSNLDNMRKKAKKIAKKCRQ